ncbi:hypothetical protein TSAR_010985 [Trichomalopsis sarcophagae]|uniref:Uncharacterized protein n=1 Tax=Trichomalopsis sarcophagae TaxID=543379 RepID=A0A232EWW5_9HYME|nr:hypothetical protein TSAR_010985 [Trichomalopsis sarcophagae]
MVLGRIKNEGLRNTRCTPIRPNFLTGLFLQTYIAHCEFKLSLFYSQKRSAKKKRIISFTGTNEAEVPSLMTPSPSEAPNYPPEDRSRQRHRDDAKNHSCVKSLDLWERARQNRELWALQSEC